MASVSTAKTAAKICTHFERRLTRSSCLAITATHSVSITSSFTGCTLRRVRTCFTQVLRPQLGEAKWIVSLARSVCDALCVSKRNDPAGHRTGDTGSKSDEVRVGGRNPMVTAGIIHHKIFRARLLQSVSMREPQHAHDVIKLINLPVAVNQFTSVTTLR